MFSNCYDLNSKMHEKYKFKIQIISKDSKLFIVSFVMFL